MRPLITALLLFCASTAPAIEVPLAIPLVGAAQEEISDVFSASNGHGYLIVGTLRRGYTTIDGVFADEQGQPASQLFPIIDVPGRPLGLASDGDGYLVIYSDDWHSVTAYARLDARGKVTRRGVLPPLTHSIAWCGVAYVAAYEEPRNPDGWVAVIDADGTLLRSMPVVRRSKSMSQFHVAAGPRGNALVTWAGSDQGVYVLPVAASSLREGTFVAPLITETPGTDAIPQRTGIASGTGGSLVVWSVVQSSVTGEIRGRRLDANGNAAGPPFVIARTDGTANVSVGAAGSRYVIAYSDRSGTRMVTVADSDQGTTPIVLSSDTFGQTLTVAGGAARALIAWGSAKAVVGLLIDSAGAPVIAQPALLSRSSYGQYSPRIAWCGDTYLATWTESGNDGRVMFARIRANGIPVDAAGRFVDAGSKSQAAPDIACHESSALIVWIDHGAKEMIRGAIVDADGTAHPSMTIAELPGYAEPAVAWNGSQYVVAWSDSRTHRINLVRVSRDEQLVDVVPHVLPAVPGSVADDSPAIACKASECVVAWSADLFSVLHPHHHSVHAVRLDAALVPIGSIRELAAPVNDEGDARNPVVIAGEGEWGIAWSWDSTTWFSTLTPELEDRTVYAPVSACTGIPRDGTATAGGYRLLCVADLIIDSSGVVPAGTSDVVAISHGGGPLAITAHLSDELLNCLYVVAGDARSRATRR